METGKVARTITASMQRGLALLVLWFCLTRGEVDSLGFGLIAAAATTALSLRVLPPSGKRLHGRRFLVFLWWFGSVSLLAGLDVARRAFAFRPELTPDLISLRLTLDSPGERVLLADLVTLLPGTLAAGLDGVDLTVHALDSRQDIVGQVRSLETQIRRMRTRNLG